MFTKSINLLEDSSLMRVSTKGRYGVRFLMDLLMHNDKGNVTLKDVAKRQGISEKYLWQVVNPLKKAGLIRSVAGPGGGYALVKPSASITLFEILSVLEGDFALVACAHEPAACPRSNACGSREVWRELEQKIIEVLNSFSLDDIAEKQRSLEQRHIKEYCI